MSEHAQQGPDAGRADAPGVPAGIDLVKFTTDLIGDLEGLRTGRVTIQQARASAELARQIIRSMHLVVSAQRLIEDRAKHVNPKDGEDDAR